MYEKSSLFAGFLVDISIDNSIKSALNNSLMIYQIFF